MKLQILLLSAILLGSVLSSQVPVFYKIGEELDLENIDDCREIIIESNYKQMEVAISDVKDLDMVFYSDTRLHISCENTNYIEECNEKGTICVGQQPSDGQDIDFNVRKCTERIYIYVRPNAEKKGEIKVNATRIDNKACLATSPGSWAECGRMSLEECRWGCDHGCTHLSCEETIKEYRGNQIITVENIKTQLCVPDLQQKITYDGICHSYGLELDSKTEKNCTAFWRPIVPEPETFHSPAFLIICIILGSLCCCSCIYRYLMTKNLQPPFNPPKCCPDFIFPRQQRRSSSIEHHQYKQQTSEGQEL